MCLTKIDSHFYLTDVENSKAILAKELGSQNTQIVKLNFQSDKSFQKIRWQ